MNRYKQVTDRVKFKCTCGADASVATGKDAILHAMPPYLRDRDPGEYLMECRKAMERS